MVVRNGGTADFRIASGENERIGDRTWTGAALRCSTDLVMWKPCSPRRSSTTTCFRVFCARLTQPARLTQAVASFPPTPFHRWPLSIGPRRSSTKKYFRKKILTPPTADVPTTNFQKHRIGALIKSGKRLILYIGNLVKIGADLAGLTLTSSHPSTQCSRHHGLRLVPGEFPLIDACWLRACRLVAR